MSGAEAGVLKRPHKLAIAFQRLVRIERIPDVHGVYGFMAELCVHEKPVGVARYPTTSFHVYWPRYPKRLLLPLLNHAAMLVTVLHESLRGRKVIVREFDALLMLAMAPLLWWFRRRLVLNINTEFYLPLGAGIGGVAMRALVALGFRFLWFDGDLAKSAIAAAFPGIRMATPLFPVPIAATTAGVRRASEEPFAVGFVGSFQPVKGGVVKLKEALRYMSRMPDVRIRIGFWDEVTRRELSASLPSHIETRSTFTAEEYNAFLAGCDAMVFLAEKDPYYYRHSGVVIDCMRNGAIPVCPDYPVLASLIRRPVKVGGVYRSLEELPLVIDAVRMERGRIRARFAEHAAGRSVAGVSSVLERFFDSGG